MSELPRRHSASATLLGPLLLLLSSPVLGSQQAPVFRGSLDVVLIETHDHSIFEDIALFGYGLEKLADSGGGQFFQVEVDSDPFVNRVLRETSAFYMLAVSTEPSDRAGKEHFIRVTTRQRGASLRYRRVLVIPRESREIASAASAADPAQSRKDLGCGDLDDVVGVGLQAEPFENPERSPVQTDCAQGHLTLR